MQILCAQLHYERKKHWTGDRTVLTYRESLILLSFWKVVKGRKKLRRCKIKVAYRSFTLSLSLSRSFSLSLSRSFSLSLSLACFIITPAKRCCFFFIFLLLLLIAKPSQLIYRQRHLNHVQRRVTIQVINDEEMVSSWVSKLHCKRNNNND